MGRRVRSAIRRAVLLNFRVLVGLFLLCLVGEKASVIGKVAANDLTSILRKNAYYNRDEVPTQRAGKGKIKYMKSINQYIDKLK